MPAPGNPPSLALAGILDGLFRLSDPVRLAQDTRAGSTRDSVKNEPDLIEKYARSPVRYIALFY